MANFGQEEMLQKTLKKKTETLAHGYSSESAQRELLNEYQHDRVFDIFQKSLRPGALDKSSRNIAEATFTQSTRTQLF